MSDNEIYLLIKYIKSVLWRVAKFLSYTEEALCLKVKGSDAGKPETSEATPGKPHVYQMNIVSTGMMSKLDESVGKVVAALERRNMLKNTRIVLLSDNGAPTLDVGVWRNWGSNHPLRGVGAMTTLFGPLFCYSTIMFLRFIIGKHTEAGYPG